jgi:hypothetical protein
MEENLHHDDEEGKLDKIEEENEENLERIPSRKSCISDSDKTDVEDLDEDVFTSTSLSPIPEENARTIPNSRLNVQSQDLDSSTRRRRPSRSCKPNSLIFNDDTTTLTPIKRRRKTDDSGASSNKTIITTSPVPTPLRRIPRNVNSVYRTVSPFEPQVTNKFKSTRDLKRKFVNKITIKKVAPNPVSSSSKRSLARQSVKRAVSALTTANVRLSVNGKKIGRPRKYPVSESSPVQPIQATYQTSSSLIHSPKKNMTSSPLVPKCENRKKGNSPPTRKMNPILAAIFSGQELGTTKTGKPKGRPIVLPSLNEVLNLNGHAPTKNTVTSPVSGMRQSSRRAATMISSHGCDCHTKYNEILANLEEQLEKKFVESTQKLRKDMQDRDDDNIRLHSKIIALQKEVEILRIKLLQTEEAVTQGKEVQELKAKHQQELLAAKKTQWVCLFSALTLSFTDAIVVFNLEYSVPTVKRKPFTSAVGTILTVHWNVSNITGMRGTKKTVEGRTSIDKVQIHKDVICETDMSSSQLIRLIVDSF